MQKIIFFHISKTAGQSFTSILDDLFCQEEIFPGQRYDEYWQAGKEAIQRYKLLRGHIPYSYLRSEFNLPMEEYFTCTFLRDPIDRIISSYQHSLRAPDFFQDWSWLSNVNHHIYHLSLLHSRKRLYTQKEHFESAKENLQSLSFFGITEQFDESMKLFCQTLSIAPELISIRKINVADNQIEPVPQTLLDELAEMNRLDIELYEYARRLFSERVQKPRQAPRPVEIISPCERLEYTMNMPLRGANWWPREGAGTTQPQIWRWTGPESRTTFFCSLAKGAYRLTVRVVNSLVSENFNSLSFSVNGRPVPCEQHRDDKWGILFTGNCVINKNNVRLDIHVPHIMRFCDADPNAGDTRKCGVAITEIRFAKPHDDSGIASRPPAARPSKTRAMAFFRRLSIKQCLCAANVLAVRILPASLKERLKSTALGTKFRNYPRG